MIVFRLNLSHFSWQAWSSIFYLRAWFALSKYKPRSVYAFQKNFDQNHNWLGHLYARELKKNRGSSFVNPFWSRIKFEQQKRVNTHFWGTTKREWGSRIWKEEKKRECNKRPFLQAKETGSVSTCTCTACTRCVM